MEPAEQVRQTFLDFLQQKRRQGSLFTAWAPPGDASPGPLSKSSCSVVVSNDENFRNDKLQAHSSSNPRESSAANEPVLKAHDYIGLAEVSSTSSSVNENEIISDGEDTDLRLALGPFKDDQSMQLRLPSSELELLVQKDRPTSAVNVPYQTSAKMLMLRAALHPQKNGFKRVFDEALGEESRPGTHMTSAAFKQYQGTCQSENQQPLKPIWPASKCTNVFPTSEVAKRHDKSERYNSALMELPHAKSQVVGWPPIRTYRRNILMVSHTQPNADGEGHSTAFVKVNMDGIPIGRKVDLNVCNSYENLVAALEEMFYSISNGNSAQFLSNGMFSLTYEDKEGDWMLVGDVPWGMFVNSVRRLRIVRSRESIGLGHRAECERG